MLNSDFLIKSIKEKKFFSLHPDYEIFEEEVEEVLDTLKIFTKCYVRHSPNQDGDTNISPFSFLIDLVPESMKKNLFHTEMFTHIFPDLKKLVVRTKPLHHDLYVCESVIVLKDNFEIDSIIVNIEVKNSYKPIFKLFSNHIKKIVKSQIQRDYSIILKKLREQ